jgi:protein-L-isoaspartate(D-aspartate) O-methyltransferase
MTIEDYRQFYADEIRVSANLRSNDLVRAFARVPREKYLGPPPWQICSAEQAALAAMGLGGDPYRPTEDPRDLYHNVLVSIDPERHLNNGHPGTLARWMEALDLAPADRVYHAGCGVGYYTAMLAEVVGPQGSVVTIDVDTGLAERARENLSQYAQVRVHAGDGAALDPGMCDAMLINAGVTHPHAPWLERLKEGGRLILPVTAKAGEHYGNGVMLKIVREARGFSARVLSVVSIFHFSTLRDLQLEPVVGGALAKRELFKVKSVRLDPHERDDACIVHGADVCLSSAKID